MASVQQLIPSLQWFDVFDPNSPELDELARRFNLHPLQIEDCRQRPQRAKIDEYGPYLFAILKHVIPKKDGRLHFDDFDVFLGTDFLITVHQDDCHMLTKLCQHVQQNKVDRLDRILYLLSDFIVDEYLDVLDESSEEIEKLESAVLQRPEPAVLNEIFRLKRRLIDFRRSGSGMREVVNAMIRREGGIIHDDLDPYFRDVYDHLVRAVDLVETQRDLLSGALDIYLSAVANRTNEVMKVLTIYGTIALPLVVITGFFGMNIHLPWTSNPHGIWYVSALLAFSTLLVLIYFKRKHWF
jgi:magnesium transporter